MLIHLIRHTTPQIEEGICYGQSDLTLAESFEAEKAILQKKLLSEYDALYTSPLQRCALLADSINSKNRFEDDRILEYNFGDWELKNWNELDRTETQNWMDNFIDQPAPGGDSIISMKTRVDAFFAQLIKSDYATIAVVTHSGVQRILHAHILQTPLSHLFRLQLDYGAVLEIKRNKDLELNTIKHL